MTSQLFETLLAESIDFAVRQDTSDFEWERFFRRWFRELGTPAFFLFKRNLGVTNTQYVELFSLLETHARFAVPQGRSNKLLFHTTEQMRRTVTDIVNMLLDVPARDRSEQVQRFAQLYYEVVGTTVAVDMFYTSCAVFLPPGIEVDLRQVCADAGYIHSVGTSVYIRNIRKARQHELETALRGHLARAGQPTAHPPFIVYAHEDFSGHDKAARDQIARGIDGTKLYVEKMSMGSARLTQIVQDLREAFASELNIPAAGPYKTTHHFSDPETIWLIGDRSVATANPANPGSDRYYICYQQTAKNDSPFYYFDENKPAWKSHTTLPHSLTGALVNATRPHHGEVVICDPFGGTGTTWLEVKRIGLPATVRCSDLSPITPLLSRDNLEFFGLREAEVRAVYERLLAVQSVVGDRTLRDAAQMQLEIPEEQPPTTALGIFRRAEELLHELKAGQPGEDQEFAFSEAFVSRLEAETFVTRLVFYVCLRAELRYQGGLRRRAMTFDGAFQKALGELLEQIGILLDLRKKLDAGQHPTHKSYVVVAGTYSPVIVPRLVAEPEPARGALGSDIQVRNACELGPESTDVIICDPPYGFNTTEDRHDLARLYSEFFDAALLALREHGHLIVCLPAESYTGRDLPYCTYSRLVSNQILAKAEALGKHVFVQGRSVPHPLVHPPYYWEADRALRRVILHYRVSRREHG